MRVKRPLDKRFKSSPFHGEDHGFDSHTGDNRTNNATAGVVPLWFCNVVFWSIGVTANIYPCHGYASGSIPGWTAQSVL